MIPPVGMKCWLDIMSKLATIPEFQGKIESVWDDDDLLAILQGARSPMVGVVYEGINAIEGADPSRQGLAGDVTISILLIMQGNSIGNVDEKPEAVRLLDEMRKTLLTQRAPSGHKWRFVREQPQGKYNNYIIFTQVWATTAILTA